MAENQGNQENQENPEGRRKDWVIFLSGALFIIALWLLAKVLAWFIPPFRSIYNTIFVISAPTVLYGSDNDVTI